MRELEGTELETTQTCLFFHTKLWLKEWKKERWKRGKYDLETIGIEGAACRGVCLVVCAGTAGKSGQEGTRDGRP